MRIVYNSFDGRFSDSPRALHEALEALDDGSWTHTWLAGRDHAASFPAAVRTVPPESPATVTALEEADLVVSNTHLGPAWVKKAGARYLQTWHGTPLKHIAGDEPGHVTGTPVPGHEDIARWDLLLSPNAVSAPRLAGAFAYDGPVAVTGYPRNDLLSSPRAGAVRERVRARLGLAPGDRAVLYAPTWRDDVLDASGRRDAELHVDLAAAARRLSGAGRAPGAPRTVLLLRLHYMVSDRLGPLPDSITGADGGVVDVSAHPDVAELYLAADAMVTDYSSAMFDFAVTGKPLLFFTYDLEHYRDDLRGFYVDLPSVAPGPVLRTGGDLVEALAALAGDPAGARAPWAERYAAFQRTYCHAEDGRATRRVLGLLLGEEASLEPPTIDLADYAAAGVAR